MSRTWFSPFVELLQPIRLIDLNGSTRLLSLNDLQSSTAWLCQPMCRLLLLVSDLASHGPQL
uniref:Uncharacterized protein n=1 Tax=Kalanchoe fedtschenkoi TaxID=63787 RepID=A0A7N0U0H4_KALFE